MTPGLPPVWDPLRDERLVCVAVRRETHDVSTFVFAAAEPRLFHFAPGQFMTFELEHAGVQRCYTIASPPTRPHRIEVTAKRIPQGAGSGWLHDAVRPGAQLLASGPHGDFTCPPVPAGRHLFLSAGSGITPLMSMARTLHDLGSDADVLFVHSARSPADLVFADELAAMARRPGFVRASIVETVPPGVAWDGLRGRLSPAMLAVLAPDLLSREVFCCGPAPYMAAVRAMLDAAGFDRARYHQESFDFALDPPPAPVPASVAAALPPALATGAPPPAPAAPVPALVPGDAGRTFSIAFARSGRTVACAPGTTVLEAARAAGLRLPSACNKGVCGTCKSALASGTVELRHGGGIRQREIDAGMTLLCCARPVSDLVVDR